MKSKVYKEYCTACGLCHNINNVKLSYDRDTGFLYPQLSEEDYDICKDICPASGKMIKQTMSTEIWGIYQKEFVGWSQNQEIRTEASSGGVLTSLCCYLLDEKIVDGIIQTKEGTETPYSTMTIINQSVDDIKKFRIKLYVPYLFFVQEYQAHLCRKNYFKNLIVQKSLNVQA